MKKGFKIFIAATVLLTGTYVFAATGMVGTVLMQSPAEESILVKTHWKQMGGFERCTPDHLRLGCWSTALAQIMFYHRLQPFGQVGYRSTKGLIVHERLDSIRFDFSKLQMRIDSTTTNNEIEALARYNYYAALAVRKDFGTDNYMQKLASSSQLEAHYAVKVRRYICWRGVLPYASGKLKSVIKSEIHQQRPLFLHFANLYNFGHSVVIDGYREKCDKFFVHLNQGQGGPQDGWYDFNKDILEEGDRKLRVIYSFQPEAGSID